MSSCQKICQISTRYSNRDETNSTAVIPDEETYESTPNIFLTTIFPTSFSWKTHQFFPPHYLGKPTNFS